MAINVTKIKSYMSNEMNIIISGLAGTGKTSILLDAASQLKWNMQYYSAATLDPYTDLVGLPVPNHELKSVEYFRPKSIDEADVVFFDEANRADPKTLNTLFELIQFRSINGEKLPKLKCVVAAINPNDGNYNVEDMDPALLDRFDVYLTSEPAIDYGYFRLKFGDKIAKEVTDFWNEYHEKYTLNIKSNRNSMAYISPRRMEKIVSAYLKIPNKSTITDSLPIGSTVGVDNLFFRLSRVSGKSDQTSATTSASRYFGLSISDFRSSRNAAGIIAVIEDKDSSKEDVSRLLNQLASSLNYNVGPERAVKNWGKAIERMSPSQVRTMTSGWTIYKKRDLETFMTKNGHKNVIAF